MVSLSGSDLPSGLFELAVCLTAAQASQRQREFLVYHAGNLGPFKVKGSVELQDPIAAVTRAGQTGHIFFPAF